MSLIKKINLPVVVLLGVIFFGIAELPCIDKGVYFAVMVFFALVEYVKSDNFDHLREVGVDLSDPADGITFIAFIITLAISYSVVMASLEKLGVTSFLLANLITLVLQALTLKRIEV